MEESVVSVNVVAVVVAAVAVVSESALSVVDFKLLDPLKVSTPVPKAICAKGKNAMTPTSMGSFSLSLIALRGTYAAAIKMRETRLK
jgi:hypothetical protein